MKKCQECGEETKILYHNKCMSCYTRNRDA